MGIIRTGAALLIAALVGGCSGDSPVPLVGGLSADSSTTSDAGGSASNPYGDTSTGSAPTGVPQPFSAPTDSAAGGRQVIEKPTMADVMMTGSLPEMSWGRADAPVTIIQYASLTCPHCRHFYKETFPQFKKAYIDTGKVRFIMREFPIGKTSGMATIALRCAKPDKYLDLYGKFMMQQASWVSQEVRLDPIFAVASQVGMKRAEFDACRQNQGMIEGLKWVKERGRKLGIIGTPNFFIQNKLIKKELSMEDIHAEVDPLLSGNTTAAAAATPR
jgi:protein-disulfide isomerase